MPTVDEHFAGKSDELRDLYDRLVALAEKLGPVEQDPKKTSIHLNRRTAFAGVATQKSALVLTLKSDREVKSRRVKRSQQTSPRRWHLEVRLDAPEQVDRELRGWIARAYALSE